MRIIQCLIGLTASLAFASIAAAQFSISGGGAAIPTAGTGGDANLPLDGGAQFPSVQPGFPGTSCVTVPSIVTTITSIEVEGLVHTWGGDLQMTLADPNGVEHLIFLRPGFLNPGSAGTSGGFTGGLHTFMESGGADLPTSSNSPDIDAGVYNQTFSSGGVLWTSGHNGILNTPMSMITGPPGEWCLTIYDWGSGDAGSFSGWTLKGEGGGCCGECFLLIGDGPGNGNVRPGRVSLQTQLNEVDQYHAVLLDSLPAFVIPRPGAPTYGQNGSISMLRSAYRRFAVEVVMFNPEVFPNNPEQHSNGLLVYIDGFGNVTSLPFGRGSMSVWTQTGIDSNGDRILQFPFSMPQ